VVKETEEQEFFLKNSSFSSLVVACMEFSQVSRLGNNQNFQKNLKTQLLIMFLAVIKPKSNNFL
jgi:hypothetical protein